MKTHKIKFLRSVIRDTNGAFFGITFTKKNGEQRHMCARIRVTAPLKGGKNNVAHINKYFTVYDVNKKDYRNVNLEEVSRFQFGNQRIIFS